MRMTQKFKQYVAFFFVSVLLATVVLGTLTPAKVEADGKQGSFISDTVAGKVLDHQLYFFLKRCMLDFNFDKTTSEEVQEWRWWWGTSDTGWRGTMYDNNNVSCSNGQYIQEAFSRFGLGNDPFDTFCRLGFTYSEETGGLGKTVDGGNTTDSCKSGKDKGDFDGSGSTSEQAADLDKLLASSSKFQAAKSKLDDAAEYMRYYRSLINGCDVALIQPYKPGAATNDPLLYRVIVVNQDGTTEEWLGKGSDKYSPTTPNGIGRDDSKHVLVETTSGGPTYKTCGELATTAANLAPQYATYLKTEGKDDTESNGNTSGGGSAASDTCESSSGPLGWILCGVLTVMDGAISKLDESINNLLFIGSDVYDAADVRESWAVIRNIALLILVPMMVLMVIGTAVGMGPFDPYTVKKALPRMLVAVMFIVLSLPITQFGVELSNALGQGLGNLVLSASPNKVDSLQDIFGARGSSDSFAGLTVAGGGAAILTGGVSIGILGSFALVTLVGLLIGFVVLVMRQVLLLMLIVIAPIAILVWIFPGNDKLWTIWRTTFIAMLMMYPLIALLVASGRFVAGIAQF